MGVGIGVGFDEMSDGVDRLEGVVLAAADGRGRLVERLVEDQIEELDEDDVPPSW